MAERKAGINRARVRTLRHAAALLANARSVDTLRPIVVELGLVDEPLPIDDATRRALGVPRDVHDAALVRGPGALRALIIETREAVSLRSSFTQLAASLAARTGPVLWLLAGVTADGEVGLACWSAERGRHASSHSSRVATGSSRAMRSRSARWPRRRATTTSSFTRAGASGPARDALSRRFYRTLEQRVAGLASSLPRVPDEERRELALLAASRLLFLVFLEAKGWLDGDARFLEHHFDACMASGGRFHRRVLLPLFFGTLNTPPRSRARAARALGRMPFLNGGLFARTPLERRTKLATLPDETLGRVFGQLLLRYRFTAREDSTAWSEAAIDPEMLGKAFEILMSSRERSASGAFYTPQPIVEAVTRAALDEALSTTGGCTAIARAPARHPAAGSRVRIRRVPRSRAGDDGRARDPARRRAPTAEVRRELLTRSIFGVDVNPMAVWLCELRLWLSVVIESDETDPLAVPPLPNLDRNIRVGDALAGEASAARRSAAGGAAIARLRERYARATGSRKRTLQRALDREERSLAVAHLDLGIARTMRPPRSASPPARTRPVRRPDRPARADAARLVAARGHGRELRAARRALLAGGALPFAWATHFPHVPPRGGFDVVIGNPPWVRLHRIPPAGRAALRARFAVFREAAWERGAAAARGGRRIRRAGRSRRAVHRAPAECAAPARHARAAPPREALALARRRRRAAARAPSGRAYSRSRTGRNHRVRSTLPSIRPSSWRARMTERPAAGRTSPPRCIAAKECCNGMSRRIDSRSTSDPASPWLALPPPRAAGLRSRRGRGHPLASSPLGPPLLGVKCGCNEAFVVSLAAARTDWRRCGAARGRRGRALAAASAPARRARDAVESRRRGRVHDLDARRRRRAARAAARCMRRIGSRIGASARRPRRRARR